MTFKPSLTGLFLDISFFYSCCHINVKDFSLPNYLPIADEGIVGCIAFQRIN